jgi:transposase
LGIKLSTAKVIVKRYKEEGTFFETKKRRQERQEEEKKQKEVSPPLEEQSPLLPTNLAQDGSFALTQAWKVLQPVHTLPFWPFGTSPLCFPSNVWFQSF